MIKLFKKARIKREYIGAYGINLIKNTSQVLLILKSRGPYKGMYDLPGGGIKKNETKEQALQREYKEEIGENLLSHKFIYEDTCTFPYISQTKGEINFQHKGYFYEVTLPKNTKIKMSPDGHDSMGAIYVDVDDIIKNKITVTSMAKKAILKSLKT